MLLRWIPLLVIWIVAWPSVGAWAEAPEIVSQGESLRASPGGEAIADVLRETRGRKLQRRGEWLRLQVDGYIWRASTSPLSQAKETDSKPRPPLQLLDYRVQWQPQDYHRHEGTPRAHVTARFHFRNNRPKSLACLEFQVKFLDLGGRLLHQQEVSCTEGQIEHRGHDWWNTLLWKEQGGPAGTVYRQLADAARTDTIRIDLTPLQAWYLDGTTRRFDDDSQP